MNNNDVSFETVLDQFQKIIVMINHLKKDIQTLNKKNNKQNKRLKKEIPKKINNKLTKFMNLNEPVSSRENVIRFISKYIKRNKLQKYSNKRYFCVNKELAELLNIEINSKITFLEINKYISHLFCS